MRNYAAKSIRNPDPPADGRESVGSTFRTPYSALRINE